MALTPSKMRALVLLEPGRMEVQQCDVPTIGPGEILVRVKACGTCATEPQDHQGRAPVAGWVPVSVRP